MAIATCMAMVAVGAGVETASASASAPTTSAVKLAPIGMNFGTVPVGQSSTKPLTILNRTSSTVSYAGASWPNLQHPGLAWPYGIWNASEPFPCWTIGPRSTCMLNFRFTPATTGPFSSTFYMVYENGGSYTTNTVVMRGVGS